MKLVYTGIISALLATGAFAQTSQTSQTLQVTGNGEFCLAIAGKADCKFSDPASCQKELDVSTSKDINSSCIIRRDVQ
jgi:hypothetical protein